MKTARASVDDYTPNLPAVETRLRRNRLRVLIAEDDEADAYLIRRALFRHPRISQLIWSKDGVEALDWIDSDEAGPDLAILDLSMPRKDGLTLLSDLSLRGSARFPVLVLTSSTSPSDCRRSWERGAMEFLTKRDSIEELATALDQAISRLCD